MSFDKELKVDGMVIKYRMPNIVEVYDLLDAADASENFAKPLKMKGEFIKNMGHLIDVSSLGVESYEDALKIENTEKMIGPLTELADIFYSKIVEVFAKKQKSKTLSK